MFQHCQYKWEYQATKEKQDAYQTLIKNYQIPEPQKFILLSQQQQNNIVKDFIKEIRKINIFPIFYYNKDGIKKEILSVINKNDVYFDQYDNLTTQATQGSSLLDFLFPNLHHITAGHKSNTSIYDTFYDDEKLFKCLLDYFKNRKLYTLKTAFFSRSKYIWNTGTNFLPIRAKAIYERFCPENGIIYDYSAGFGGRMLGALSSNNNYKYIAVQPNSDTYYNLLQLGQIIEGITNRTNSFQIYKQGSENFIPKEKIDFAFSCPPFFDLQKYSNQPTQSIIKFPQYEDWLKYYVKPTIKNCYNSLKQNGIFATDLMNYKKGNTKIYLIEDWLKLAQQEGFVLKQICNNNTRNRKKQDDDKQKILVFTKHNHTNINLFNINPNVIQKYNQRLKKIQQEKIKKQKTFCYYDIYGQLINSFLNIADLEKQCGYPKEIILKYLNKKRYNEYYFKVFTGDKQILQKIDIKPVICKINNVYFDSYSEAGRFLGVSRQAVHQAMKRKNQKINGYQIIWFL